MSIRESIQRVVYSLGEGAGRALLHGVIALVVMLLALSLFAAHEFRGLRDGAGMEWAQLGRNLAAGRGYTTYCLRPADLAWMARRHPGADLAAGMPDLRHAPAYPYLLALAFRLVHSSFAAHAPGVLFAPEARVVLPVAFLCLGLCGVCLMTVGMRVFDGRVGAAALAVFALSAGVLRAGLAGDEAPLAMLLTTLSLALTLASVGARARQAPAAAWLAALGGAVAGLAGLTRYGLLIVPLAGAVLLARGFVRWRGAVVALHLVAALAVVTPWLAHNWQVGHSPLGLAPHTALNGTALYEAADGWDRAREPLALDSRDVVHALGLKVVDNLRALYSRDLPHAADGLVLCFFLAALFFRFDSEQAGPLKWCVLLGLALTLGVGAFQPPSATLFLPFLPMLTVVSVAMLFKVLDESPFLGGDLRQALVVLWVGLAALPLLLTLLGAPARATYPPYAPPFVQYVAGLIKPGEVLATDIPWAAAWYGDRPALLIPQTTADLVALQRGGVRVGAVYLTQVTGDQPYTRALVQGPESTWLPLLQHLVPADFPWQHGFAVPPGRRDQIVLTDAARWADGGAAPAKQPSAVAP